MLKLGYKASTEQFGPTKLLQFSRLAEQSGFDSVFISDHFQPWKHHGGHAPFSLVWLGALGALTSRITIGTSVLTPTFRYTRPSWRKPSPRLGSCSQRLGDRDLAVHVERTRRLRQGETLSSITADFCRRLGVGPRVLPATDDPVRTRLQTDEGWLDFQDYFVRLQCRPVVRELAFEGAEDARPHTDLLAALRDERLRAVIICPSNPFISVEPILAVPGMRQALSACAAPVIAVSPIIGGRAVKGPAKMMGELGITPSAAAVAKRYGDLLDGYVMDIGDAEEVTNVAPRVTLAPTLMTNLAEREELGRVVLEAASALASMKRGRVVA